jgi:hypothetical protein
VNLELALEARWRLARRRLARRRLARCRLDGGKKGEREGGGRTTRMAAGKQLKSS